MKKVSLSQATVSAILLSKTQITPYGMTITSQRYLGPASWCSIATDFSEYTTEWKSDKQKTDLKLSCRCPYLKNFLTRLSRNLQSNLCIKHTSEIKRCLHKVTSQITFILLLTGNLNCYARINWIIRSLTNSWRISPWIRGSRDAQIRRLVLEKRKSCTNWNRKWESKWINTP